MGQLYFYSQKICKDFKNLPSTGQYLRGQAKLLNDVVVKVSLYIHDLCPLFICITQNGFSNP